MDKRKTFSITTKQGDEFSFLTYWDGPDELTNELVYLGTNAFLTVLNAKGHQQYVSVNDIAEINVDWEV